MSIGNKLKTKRNQLKLTMDDVANALKVSRQTIYKYENGIIKNIPLDKINKLAELLEVSPTFLTGWEEKWNEEFSNVHQPTLIRTPYIISGISLLLG